MTKRVLFLISDTGGGHRAGAQAVGAALDEIDGATRFEWRIDDIATHCTFPLSKLGPAYSAALRFAPPIYGALYVSVYGAVAGLLLGQLHVWWRHTTELGWRTPGWAVKLARALQIVLPEDHDGHHRNPEIEFGDIFRFYDAPARAFIAFCRNLDPKHRAAAIRRAAIARKREAAASLKRREMLKQTS